MYPCLSFISEAGVHGSRIASLALGVRDDNSQGLQDAICNPTCREGTELASNAERQKVLTQSQYQSALRRWTITADLVLIQPAKQKRPAGRARRDSRNDDPFSHFTAAVNCGAQTRRNGHCPASSIPVRAPRRNGLLPVAENRSPSSSSSRTFAGSPAADRLHGDHAYRCGRRREP